MMNFCGPHSNFIPHSPLSYSTSYSPGSPLKEQQVKLDGPPVVVADSGLRGNIPLGSTNKSILKNPTTLFFKEQHKKLMKSNENIVDAIKKPTETHVARKETLKTVAFGLTTRLEDTVLANKSAASSAANRLSKTVIFSHEAQSLHKIILAQQAEIVELRGKVDELMVSDGRRCSEYHEQKSTIAELSSRLVMVERTMANIKNDSQKRREETRENGKTNVQKYIENNLMGEEEADEEDTMNERRVKTSVGKRMVLKQRQLNNGSNNSGKYQNREVESIRSQKRNMAMPSIEEENSLVHRNHILQRLDDQMRKNPNFENRIKSMLRVWTDDMSSPAIGTSILEHPRDESGGGASMVVRVTTQHQEVFYSSSPGRNKKPLSKSRRPKPANQQPIVTELSDESTADEQPETVPNVRRSDLCTDDAEFFHNNEQLEDDFEDWAKRNDTNNQQPFRRRKREATSAIRNKYK